MTELVLNILGHNRMQHRLKISHNAALTLDPVRGEVGADFCHFGDAILDYLVTTTIFSYKDRSQLALQPQRMHIFRVTAVNVFFFAFRSPSRIISILISKIALFDSNEAPLLVFNEKSIFLFQFLRYTFIPALISVFNATRDRFTILEPAIDIAFDHSLVYSSQAFAVFAPKKGFSDIIETMLSAIYIDTNNDLNICETFLRRFEILSSIEIALKKSSNLIFEKKTRNSR